MTRTKIAAIITATVLVVGSLYIGSNVLPALGGITCPPSPPEDCNGIPNGPNGPDGTAELCGIDPLTGEPLRILHFDKIIFENEDDLLNRDGNLAAEEGSIMDIKVLDDPNRIEFPMQKAVDKLNAVGWTTEDEEPITLDDLELIDVEYAVVCVPFFDGQNER